MTPNIEVNLDNIKIEGTIVKRPSRIPRSEWMKFWEQLWLINSLRPNT
jgi:hypothetical protein